MDMRGGKEVKVFGVGLLRRLCGKPRKPAKCPDFPASERMREDRRLAVAPDIRASAHDDGIALLDISTGRVFLSNQTGSRIWRGLVAGLSADAISEEISREWGVGPELVRRHTSSFIFELESRGLLRRVA